MYKLLIILLIPFFSFSQYSSKITEMTIGLNAIDTLQTRTKYNNGKIKYSVNKLKYIINDCTLQVPFGELKEYYKTGKVKRVIKYDAFGIIVGIKSYSKNGIKNFEIKAVKIDTKTDNLKDFLTSSNHLIIDYENKNVKRFKY